MRRIPLRRRDGSIRAFALVDDADFESLSKFRWSRHTKGYAFRTLPGRGVGTELLHRAVMGLSPGDGLEVDHRNHDRLDCRRENLIVTTRRGNAQNFPALGGASRFRGVSSMRSGRWRASVNLDRRQISAGVHDTEIEAAIAAQELRERLMPLALPDRELERVLRAAA